MSVGEAAAETRPSRATERVTVREFPRARIGGAAQAPPHPPVASGGFLVASVTSWVDCRRGHIRDESRHRHSGPYPDMRNVVAWPMACADLCPLWSGLGSRIGNTSYPFGVVI